MRRAAIAAVLLAAAFAHAAALAGPGGTAPTYGVSAADGRVVWCGSRPCPPETEKLGELSDFEVFSSQFTDSLELWAALAADSARSPAALREYARLCLARGRFASADSAWGAARLTRSVWAWLALEARADAWLGVRDTARAESLLAAAVPGAWPDADRAAWQLKRALLAASRARTGEAEELARLTLRLYPSLGAAGGALALLDTLAARRGDSLDAADERAGAESDALRGARASAARRLRHVRPRVSEADRWKLALRLAEVLRASRMPRAAQAAADTALLFAPPGDPRAEAALERARALRDAGNTDSALAAFARVGRSEAAAPLRATAWWEYAREAEDESRWTEALDGLKQVAQLGERRADEARVRAGLVHWVRAEADSARRWLRRSDSEAAHFWLGISLRSSDRAVGDSLLAGLASLPGYGFYRAAARETLGVRGWSGSVLRWGSEDFVGVDNELIEWGLPDEAMFELVRWAAVEHAEPNEWLRASAWAYQAARPAPGTRWAERAFAAAAGDDSLAWAIVPWAYPPAFEAEVAAAETLGIERSLLWALIRQESRFDPRARSRSDALGLTQLKVATAGDAAGWLREPRPREVTLFAPDTSVRLGARYLARMLERFGGVTAVALAAYNAGPGTIRGDWRALLERGGEALYAEFASNADSQDYVKRILGFRQAYRELRPTTVP